MSYDLWTLSVEDNTIGFSHTPEGATSLATEYLLDRDEELNLPWRKTEDQNAWSMRIDSLGTLVLRHEVRK